MDYALLYGRLVPQPEYRGKPGSVSFNWTDARPEPTQAELDAEWEVYQTEESIKANNVAAYQAHEEALKAGYLHSDGYTYHCSEAATIDMVKVLTLFDLDPNEPVTVVTLDGTIRDLSIADFRALGTAIGNYQYSLRKTYWAALQR